METLFKRMDARGRQLVGYELNPPFNIFCPGSDKHNAAPGEGPGPSGAVREVSLVVPQGGFEPPAICLEGSRSIL